MAHAIFISYRRDDTEGETGRLFDDLTRAFGNDAVFMDVSGIDPGTDFRKAIDDNVACCGVQLAVIGPTWATIIGSDGARRLDNENDYVRLEIASALKRNIAVIPVLVHDAHMPHADQLPDNLKDLAYRNSVELTHARWNSDVALLVKALEQYVHADQTTETEPVHAAVPVQLPPLHPAPETGPVNAAVPAQLPPLHAAPETTLPPAKPPSRFSAGLIVLAIVVAALVLFFVLKHPFTERGARALNGRWTNHEADGHNAIVELDISGEGDQLAIHAWGLCRPSNCDWGTQDAVFDGRKAKATWSMLNDVTGQEKGRVATVTVSPSRSGTLDVLIENTYAQRPANSHQLEFVRGQ